jgi:alpha-glucosidase
VTLQIHLRTVLAAWALAGCGASAHAGTALKVQSPDRHVVVKVRIDGGHVSWQALLDGRAVLERAPLGIGVVGEASARVARFGKTRRFGIDDRYPWYGVHAEAREQGNGVAVPLLHAGGGVAWTLEMRAYDNGVAFRMTLPGSEPRVPEETSGFRPTQGSAVWSFDPTQGQYEGVYRKTTATELPKGRFMAPPVVMELPGDAAYVAITEGRLQDYPGVVLQSDGEGTFLARPGNEVPADKALEYFEGADTARRLAIPVALAGPIVTPWHVVMIARTLNGLVNNDIVSDVCDPPDPAIFPLGPNTPWIRPGRAVWNFLDGGASTPEGSRAMSRMAADLGIQYQEVEGYWQDWSEAQLKELVDYSRGLGVGIWLWKNRRDLSTRESREAFFDLCNRTGVVGVKIDFFDSEAKDTIDLYREILRETAAHHLLVNFHGSDKPTGEQRTWPNELTREAIEGMEYCCSDTGQPDAPRARHAVTVPFTRLLAGPADYTPMLFDKGLNGTTWANQIASAVIITSPLLTFAANPVTILDNPAAAVIRDISSVWDETLVLPPSQIGETAVFARRKGGIWFLACMNGDHPRTMDIPLGFLGDGSWQARTVSDVPEHAAAVVMGQKTLTAGDTVHLTVSAGGGYVAEFRRE